jgi:hypothetical protein
MGLLYLPLYSLIPYKDSRIKRRLGSTQSLPDCHYVDDVSELSFLFLAYTDVYFSAEPGVLKPFQYSPLLHTIAGLMKGSSPSGIDVAVKSLEALLPRAEIRKTVWTMPEVIKGSGYTTPCRF